MKRVIQVVLVLAIIFLGYALYQSIMNPIEFKEKRTERYQAAIERLKDIRKAEQAYKDVYGSFTGSFDTLITFVQNDSLPIVKAVGSIPNPDEMTEKEALAKGLISRDTIYIRARDSLFNSGFNAAQMRFVPFTNKQDTFQLEADKIKTESGVEVNVCEAKVHNDVLLKGLDRQLVINMNDEAERLNRYPGVKVGDINEPNNFAGNWE